MRLRNKNGVAVDPVPFFVVASLGVMILLAWGPLYLKSHGVVEPVAVAISVTLSAATVCVAYHRFVWTSNPNVREEVPAETRYLRLLYGICVGVAVVLALVALLHV